MLCGALAVEACAFVRAQVTNKLLEEVSGISGSRVYRNDEVAARLIDCQDKRLAEAVELLAQNAYTMILLGAFSRDLSASIP